MPFAACTGRSRIVKKVCDGHARLSVENRPGSSNLAETQSFMDDKKRILVFSDAGGTGRSYHADLSTRNRRKRIHYMLEPGWKADTAIQGLGRSNRTNQAQPPLFRPVATNVKGEKRFLSTIAKRLDSLGAITRGQRQTGGQGLFRPEDNLESPYARAALIELYTHIFQGKVVFASLGEFENATGLRLTASDGSMFEELPPITTFLNRVLALPIALQTGSSNCSRNCWPFALRPQSPPARMTSASKRRSRKASPSPTGASCIRMNAWAPRPRCSRSGARTRTSR
jgi:hypothetical protein